MESDDLRRCSCFSVWQLLPTTSLEKGYPRSTGSPVPPPSPSGGELVEGRPGRRRADVQGLSLAHLLLLAERDGHPGLPAPWTLASIRFSRGPSFRVSNSLSGPLAWGRSQGRVGGDLPWSSAFWRTRNPLTPRFTAAYRKQSFRWRAVRGLVPFVRRSGGTGHQGPPCVGTAAPPRLSRGGKLEEIGAPGMCLSSWGRRSRV